MTSISPGMVRSAAASVAVTAALFAFATQALAGGVAELRGAEADSAMRVEFDGERLRIEPRTKGEGGYLIARDGKLYSVSVQDGKPMVMDVGAMMKMLGPALRQAAPPQALDDVGEFRSLKPLRRSEEVAGIKGELHELIYVARDGSEKRTELVLASDPRLVELSRAMMAMGSAMQKALGHARTPGNDAVERQLRDSGKGILRFGDDYRLLSLSGPTPAAARFELPAAPMAMPAGFPGMPGGFPGMPAMGAGGAAAAGSAAAPAAAPATGSGFSLPGLFGSKAERQQSRAEDKVGSEVDAASDRAVDKAIERAFGRLLGR